MASFHTFTPYLGTEVYKNLDKYKVHILHKDWEKYDCVTTVAETQQMNTKDVISALRRLYESIEEKLGFRFKI